MAEENFSDIGRVEALARLYEGTPFHPAENLQFETDGKASVASASRMLLEGIDFNLVYFPLKHLGYKAVIAVTGELYAALARPRLLSVRLGLSAKLDLAQVREIWTGIVAAAKEHGYGNVDLDLGPSQNGLSISVSAVGETAFLTSKSRPRPQSKDLLCVSGNLGGAFFGLQVLAGIVAQLEETEIFPSSACLVTRGLADAVKRIARATGLGAKVYADKIPFEGNSFDLGRELDIDPVSAAMNGGEDYRLLLAVPILKLEKFRHDFQTFDIIGHLALPEAGTVLVSPDGLEHPLKAQGWKD